MHLKGIIWGIPILYIYSLFIEAFIINPLQLDKRLFGFIYFFGFLLFIFIFVKVLILLLKDLKYWVNQFREFEWKNINKT